MLTVFLQEVISDRIFGEFTTILVLIHKTHGFVSKTMNRRQLLRYFCVVTPTIAATAATYSLQSRLLAAHNGSKVLWDYFGKKGAKNWGKLSPQFLTCRLGQSQSPINLTSAISASIPNLQFNYNPSTLRIFNNGHTIGVNYDNGSMLTLNGETYELIQFHFHHPSEHTVDNKSYSMELHLIHKSKRGFLAVVGVFLKQGNYNQLLESLWRMMPYQESKEVRFPYITINAQDLIPQSERVYMYYGSLTTPPCSENIYWIVFQEPLEISTDQIQQFAGIFPMNARPVQELNSRFLLQSSSHQS